jgi:hypothetical protein
MVAKLGISLDPAKLLPQPMVVNEGNIIESDYTEREE